MPQRMNCGSEREQCVPHQMWHCQPLGLVLLGPFALLSVEQGGETMEPQQSHGLWDTQNPSASSSLLIFCKGHMERKCHF